MVFHDVGETIRGILIADPGVSAIAGSRVFSDHFPQKQVTPAIVFYVITETQEQCLVEVTGFAQATLQIESITDPNTGGRTQANLLWSEVNRALLGKRGVFSGTPIRTITPETGHYTLTDRPEAGSDQFRFRTVQDFGVTYFYRETG